MDARDDRGVERDRWAIGGTVERVARCRVAYELFDEERYTAGFLDEPAQARVARGAAETVKRRAREQLCLGERERGERELDESALDREPARELEVVAQHRARGGLGGAVADQHEAPALAELANERREQGCAVGIRPLQVVDHEDERAELGDRR